MFYSQFILAKKGPLGTIWIAAHLERKLRKNQVSDTDIGVSVDSILFPEMPIALRLSSHLLLGVVRIYSKKVSYLFDDCSEALLKVKNAFRANAVDLPPEESTAPYHAITLPETFDLDDFELPDNENLQGSFVDHHVGAKDQITLQDTMEGVIYTTSEFGRDERFGDGEASHLDLNEELVVEKAATAVPADETLNSSVDPQASLQATTPLKDDEDHDAFSDDDGVDQMDYSDGDDDGDADYVPDEYAEGPCTPGLWEEPNLPNIQETPTCDEESVKEKLENASQKVTEYVPHQQEKSTPVEDMAMEDMSVDDFGSTRVTDTYVGDQVTVNDGHEGVTETNYENAIAMDKEHGVHSVNDNRENWVRVQGNLENAYNPTSQLVSNSETLNEHEKTSEPIQLTNVAYSLQTSAIEKPFNVSRDSTFLQGEGSHATNTFDLNLQEIHFTQSGHDEDLGACNLYNQQSFNLNQGNNTNSYTSHPERLLAVQERSSNATQQDTTNIYTSQFPATERLLPVQETFSDVTQAYNTNTDPVQERFSDVTQGYNTNPDRLLPVQERFSDVPQGYNTNTERLLPVQERFSDATQQDNSNIYTSQISATERLLPVQERFSDVPQQENTNTYTSPFTVTERLPAVQERFPDVNNTNIYTSNFPGGERLLGVQEKYPDVTQGNNTNSYTSHFPAAERLLAVQERFSDAVLRQSTPVQENIVRVDGGHFASDMLTGKKRGFSESSLMTQSISFGEPSGSLTTKTTAHSVPSNDDILSSILVGRPSDMKVQPTPPTKRQRQSLPKNLPKTAVPKRKVPMDQSTVLHGDVIRQQLTDTSDIRRPRKKVSCTWLDLSMIHKQLWEDIIFSESLFTGVSIKLASLHNRSYDLRKIRVSRREASSEFAPALKSISQNDENIPVDNLHEANKDVHDSEPIENNTTNPNYDDTTQEHINATNEVTKPISSEISQKTATIEGDAFSQMAVSGIQSDEKTDLPSVGVDSSIDINSQYIESKNNEIKVDIASEEKISEANDEVVVVVGPEIVTVDQEVDHEADKIGKNEEEILQLEVESNAKNLEESCSKDVLLDDKEIAVHEDANPEATTHIEDNHPNNRADGDELEYAAIGNNTDFLNFDDEEDNDAEEADEDLSDGEAKRLDDNSGWSSRTKAVSKYLQVMFDKEAEHGRTALRMNSLLVGKTRKEASRMFFETLVLKTKDYIHVEQNNPFENIDILPRAKLLKSDF